MMMASETDSEIISTLERDEVPLMSLLEFILIFQLRPISPLLNLTSCPQSHLFLSMSLFNQEKASYVVEKIKEV